MTAKSSRAVELKRGAKNECAVGRSTQTSSTPTKSKPSKRGQGPEAGAAAHNRVDDERTCAELNSKSLPRGMAIDNEYAQRRGETERALEGDAVYVDANSSVVCSLLLYNVRIIANCATYNADGAYKLYMAEAEIENLCVDAYDMINTDDAEANGDRKAHARKGRMRDAVAADSEVEEGEAEHQLYCATNACNNDSNAVDAEVPQSFVDDIAAQQRITATGNDTADDIAIAPDICAVSTNDTIISEELMAHQGLLKHSREEHLKLVKNPNDPSKAMTSAVRRCARFHNK